MRPIKARWIIAVSIAALTTVACASDEPAAEQPTMSMADHGTGSVAAVANACPTEGCKITFVDAVSHGKEIEVTWKANFQPDVSKNHIHIYWDIYTADQVTSDAEARGQVQGEWVPTDSVPTYVTGGAVSVARRGGSTTLCATAGDRDHVVIDSSIVDCIDVSGLL